MTSFRSASGAPIVDGAALVEMVRAGFGVTLGTFSQVVGGQDSDAVVFQATTTEPGATWAVKVSRSTHVRGLLAAAALAGGGGGGIPAPLLTSDGQPYATCRGRTLSLIPWIDGRSGYRLGLCADQWREFGSLLARIHGEPVALTTRERLPVERYRTPEAALARTIDRRIRAEGRARPRSGATSADTLIREWSAARDSIGLILDHLDGLGDELRATSADLVVSHGDAHIGNLLLDENGAVWLLDWDEVALAPRERDLMFIVGGVLADAPVTPDQQEWFFEGYGPAEIDLRRLAYYRCSWAVQDLADFGARVLDQPDGSPASAQALGFIRGILSPTGIVELARSSLENIEAGPRQGACT